MEERKFERRELEVLKDALARILQEENPLPPDEQQARDEELTRRLSFDDDTSSLRDLESRDLTIISRLLHQVRLLERDDVEELPNKPTKSDTEASCDGTAANDKHVVETMVQVANAAAEAAKAAAASSGKILEITETVLSNSETKVSNQLTTSGGDSKGRKTHKKDASKPSKQSSLSDKNMAKKLGRQNQMTHWILGVMIVTTAIWRFKLLTMIIGVRNTFSNPFQTLGDMVSDSFKGGSKEEQTSTKENNRARALLPSVLGREEKQVKKVEETKRSTTEVNDFKLGDVLDNILNVGKPNHDNDNAAKEE